MRIVFFCPDFYCPAEMKEIKEIFIPLGEALSVISAISAGLLLYHATGFSTKEYFCPAEIKEIKEIFIPPRRSTFCYFCYFCGTIITSCGKFLLSRSHRLCRFARRSHRLCRFACRRNKRNKGNSSFGCCLRSAFGLKTSGSGTSES